MTRPRLQFLSIYAGMRAVERSEALAAFLTLMGFMAGHALLETARDALFLSRLPATQLPWVYLSIAVVALLLTEVQQRYPTQRSRPRELGWWLVLCSGVTVGFWLLLGVGAGVWVYYALYTWSGVVATLVAVRFWTLLGQVFTVTQAKRLFALIGSGSVLGAIVGSGLARALTEVMAARHLVVFAAGAFLITSLAPTLLERREEARRASQPDSPRGWPLRQVLRHIWTRPYLIRIAILALVSTVTFTLVDFIFKSVVDRNVPPAELAGFFSSVYFFLNILSLIVQLSVVSRLVRSFGVNVAQSCVPAFLLAGTLGFLAGGVLVMALLLKGLDGGLRHSLHRTTTELLFFPISDRVRRPVKAVIDVFGQRGGQALGSLLILLVLTVTTQELVFAGLALVASAAWLWLTLDLKHHYVAIFRQTLEEDITPTQLEFPALDVASLETLIRTLNDPDDRRVMAAMNLLTQQEKTHLIPPLVLYHPSSQVVLRALETFAGAGRKDFLPISEKLLAHADPWVRAASLRVNTSLDPQESRLREALRDESSIVRATATVGLVTNGFLSGQAALQALESFIQADDGEVRLAMARAIRQQPSEGLEEILLKLGDGQDTALRLQVIRAMGEVRSKRFLGYLVQALAQRSLREEASRALVAHGPQARTYLKTSLQDAGLPNSIRRQLPSAMADFGTGETARILVAALKRENDGMVHFRILRALGKMRRDTPSLDLDTRVLGRVIENTQSRAFELLTWRHSLMAGARADSRRKTVAHRMLLDLLRSKQHHALERLFRLLNLLYRDEDFENIHRGVQSPKRGLRAASRELLEHLVEPPLCDAMLALIDDLYDTTGEHPMTDHGIRGYDQVLLLLLKSGSESLSSLAAYQVAELGLNDFRESMRSMVGGVSTLHSQVLERSLSRLEG